MNCCAHSPIQQASVVAGTDRARRHQRRTTPTGLGLASVKQLVELHGGTIRAKSPGKGQGATFVLSPRRWSRWN